ncbi:hypothetical protein ACHAXH_003875 [Discostella pseudostelligera]
MIPPIPPFVIDDDFMDNDENDGGWDEDDDFIAAMEAGLERDVEVEDFALQFLNELERDLLSDLPLGDTSLLFDAPPPLASNDDDLHLDDLDDEYNVTTDNQQKRIISLPRDAEELRTVSKKYHEVGLPGAMGSKDVVHVKWSRAPAGDFNRCKVRTEWYSTVEWEYFTIDGVIKTDVGYYLICDNGYLRWPTSICPYLHADKTSMEGYFSTNLESVRKDVECVFGIIKKRWKVLDHGFKFHSMAICEKIFFTCCCLHNEMLDMMESRTTRYHVLRGLANQTDGI